MTHSLTTPSFLALFALLAPACLEDSADESEDMLHMRALIGLANSDFEIDEDANLAENAGGVDWAGIDENRSTDGVDPNDNAYSGGAKESSLCPTVGLNGIPPNKSDLKHFGVHAEQVQTLDGGRVYLHLFWSRVQDPTGTTLMDIEFNQLDEDCGNGVNKVRSNGDMLLEYALSSGGTVPTIMVRFWQNDAWGDPQDLTQAKLATGSINSTFIPEEKSDGLGSLDPRTFGEASIDLTGVLEQNGGDNNCVSFASAFVKSRSSDSFGSALKDFIAPTPVNITSCGRVVIRKQTDPSKRTGFGFTSDVQTVDPLEPADQNFTLDDGDSKTFTDVLFGTYTVTEAEPGSLDLTGVDCSDSYGVEFTVDLVARTVTFTIDDANDVLDCTFKNQARGQITIEKVSLEETGLFAFDSPDFGSFSLTTTAPGAKGGNSRTFTDLVPGSYSVSEDMPDGWMLDSRTCSDGSSPTDIQLSAGESITCSFTNRPQRGAIRIEKTQANAASGPGAHPQSGVHFMVSGGELVDPVEVVTDVNGVACLGNLPLSEFAGDYVVTEMVPANYTPAGDVEKSISVTTMNACPNGDLVTFHNLPLTNITVIVDSLVVGGTSSTIECVSGDIMGFEATGPGGDGSLTMEGMLAGQYVCTVIIN